VLWVYHPRYSRSELLDKYVAQCAKEPDEMAEMMLDMHSVEVEDDPVDVSDLSEFEEFVVTEPTGEPKISDMSGADLKCYQLLNQIKARQAANRVTFEGIREDGTCMEELPERQAQRLGCGRKLPPPELDKSTWDEVLDVDDVDDDQTCARSTRMKKLVTLSQVFAEVRLGDGVELTKIEPVLGPLWQCLTNIRTKADHHALPRPYRFRTTKKPLNWYASAQRLAAQVRAICGLPAKRCSRAYAWRNLAASFKKRHGLEDAAAEVCAGTPVLYCPPKDRAWRVGVILTCWRYTAKKGVRSGAKPCTMAIPRDVCRYCRICQMQPDENDDSTWRCRASSSTRVCDINRVALFLSAEAHPSIDGLKLVLSSKSLEAVRHAHLWDEWPAHLRDLDDFKSARQGPVADLAFAAKQQCKPVRKRRQRRKQKARKAPKVITPAKGVEIIDDDNESADDAHNSVHLADSDMSDAEATGANDQSKASQADQVETVHPVEKGKKTLKSLQKKTKEAVDMQEKPEKSKEILVPWWAIV